MAALGLEAVSKTYRGSVPAVDAVTLEVGPGETLAVIGPSGCGKSTLLRLAAGLERPDSGRVWVEGRDATGLPPERRGVGLVFQDYALFPHRTVLGNVAYGLEERRLPGTEVRARAAAALERVGLGRYGERRVSELSGGERQRVALARSLAPEPGVLLLDEPLSNLDERLRACLRLELGELFSALGTAIVLVTHDRREALALADRVALMRAGRLVQVGPPRTVYEEPADAWAARFLGHENLLAPAEAARLGLSCPPGHRLLVPGGALRLAAPDTLGARTATVRRAVFEGRTTRLALEVEGVPLELETATDLPAGAVVGVVLEPATTRVVPEEETV